MPIPHEVAVTVLAALELVRRRQVTVHQDAIFGPIVIEPVAQPASDAGGEVR